MANYRLLALSVRDFKRIITADIDLSNTLTVVGGNNAQGKSSAIDAFMTTVFGMKYAPMMPVRQGAERSETTVKIETPVGVFTINRRITASGGTSISMKNEEGMETKAPQRDLDRIFSFTCADPLRFTRLTPQERVKELRKILALDFTELDEQRARLEQERKDAKRDLDRLEAQFAGMEEPPADTPANEVSITDLTATLREANEHNAIGEGMKREADVKAGKLTTADEWISKQQEAVDRLRAELAAAEQTLAGYQEKRAAFEKEALAAQKTAEAFAFRDTAEIEAQIAGAEEINRNVRAARARELARDEWYAARDLHTAKDDAIKGLEAEKRRLLAETKFPVDGMTIDDAEVYLNGIPFGQASTAEQLRASVPLAFHSAGKLPFAIIRDGSLLDHDSLALVAELTERAGAQLIIERVGQGEECTVIFDGGEVAGVQGKLEVMA